MVFCKNARPSADRHASTFYRGKRREEQNAVGFNYSDVLNLFQGVSICNQSIQRFMSPQSVQAKPDHYPFIRRNEGLYNFPVMLCGLLVECFMLSVANNTPEKQYS